MSVREFGTLIDALNAAPDDRLFITACIRQNDFEQVTFAEFRRRARLHAKLLLDHGVCPDDRVVIVMPQSIATMTTFVGAMMLGCVPSILSYPNSKIEPSKYLSGLAGVTSNLAARIVVIDEEFPEKLLGHIILNDGSTLLRMGSAKGTGDVAELPDPGDRADCLAFIQHSAGTTGMQKGVALTHAAVLRQLEHLASALKVDGETDHIYSWLPLYHDMGLIACFMLPMACHLPVAMQSPLDWVMHPETMLEVITKYKCTLAWLPNFAFQFIPRRTPQGRWSQYDLSHVRALINCSEPVRASSLHEFQRTFAASGLRKSALQTCYAMAENVFAVTQSDISRPDGPQLIWVDGSTFRSEHMVVCVSEELPGAMSFVSSGQVLAEHEIILVSETGAALAEDNVGEILIRSDCLFRGYYNRPDLTAEAFGRGWCYTGDLGFLHGGELYVVGRKKDLLIVGGENLYPHDIEEIVAGHPAIHDGRVIAIGVYNPDLGTEDIIVVGEVEQEHLLAHAAEIEREIRGGVVVALGLTVRKIFLKPPRWLVKSTAGKPSRSSTREKLFREHPDLHVVP